MSLKLYELATDANEADFRPITDLESEAFHNPFFGFWQVFNGPTLDELCTRQLAWHKEDPTSRWFYVKDEETGDVVGGAQWNIYEQNPYAKETTMLTPYWQPEGTLRDIKGQLLLKFLSYRPTRMNEPHILLSFCFTHPEHRRRGVGRTLMEWGVKKGDELGLPIYIEATELGVDLYKSCGFTVEGDIDLDATAENPSEEFVKIREELGLPIHGLFMRRIPHRN